MNLNPFEAVSSFFLGLIEQKKFQQWIKLFVSLAGTVFCTFLGVFGSTVLSTYSTLGAIGSLTIGLGTASLLTSVTVLWKWRRHPLTRGLPIAVPGNVEDALNKTLTDEGVVMTESK